MAQASSASARGQQGRRRAVAFDTSFLVAVMERPTPWAEDIMEKVGTYRPVLLASVRDELSRLASGGGGRGRSASLVLRLLEDGRLSFEPDGGGKPDDEIISFALREGAAVATIDSELASRLRASRVGTVITLRDGRVSL